VTSTGYGPRGATVEDVRLIRRIASPVCRIKASGGIKGLATLTALVEAGAERIGTSAGQYAKLGRGLGDHFSILDRHQLHAVIVTASLLLKFV
jgi:deoxyribose-phosphate aldolase